MSGLHFHTLMVSEIRRDGDDAAVVTLHVPAALSEHFSFLPGQYLTLRAMVHGEDLRRSYSICAAAGEAMRVGVRRVPGGAFSNWLHQSLKAGDRIEVLEPQGRFGAVLSNAAPGRQAHKPDSTAVQANVATNVLAIAGGSGITPILSIIKTLLEQHPGTRCTLLYGNRTVASTMFKEELEDLKNRYLARFALHPVFSREQVDAAPGSPLARGRLDRERIGLFLQILVNPRAIDAAFVCGPHALNDEAQAALLDAGIAPERIHIERFGIPPEQQPVGDVHAAQPGDADASRVSIVRDGITREIVFHKGDASILDAAARAGLDVPYSCKSGVCATCRAKLIDGQVRMDRNFALDASDIDAGFVLTCQAHPLSERVVVSFDER